MAHCHVSNPSIRFPFCSIYRAETAFPQTLLYAIARDAPGPWSRETDFRGQGGRAGQERGKQTGGLYIKPDASITSTVSKILESGEQ
jgi:hypothetical protein